MAEYGFAACLRDDALVYGAQRPGYPGKYVQKHHFAPWIGYMQQQGVSHIVCLLTEDELDCYQAIAGGLLKAYAEAFGEGNVLWAPTADRSLLSVDSVKKICYFLYEAAQTGQKSVIHCSAGMGRTGQALAAWLVFQHRETERGAIKMVEKLNRTPREAVFHRNASEAELLAVLGVARELEKPV